MNREERECTLAVNPAPRRTVMQVTWSLVAGGAEMYAFTVASRLDPARYRSVMCAVDQGGALVPEVEAAGVPYTVMNRRQGIDWRLMWRLFKLFRQNCVSVVQTHHFNQLFYSVVGAKLCGARIVHTEHSVELYKRRRYRIALRLLAHFCHAMVAIGADAERVLVSHVRIPRRKLNVIRAGVDIERFNVSRATARRDLGIAETDKVVSIIARLYPEKNHLLLLRAFNGVVNRSANSALQEESRSDGETGKSVSGVGDRVCTDGATRDGRPYMTVDAAPKYRLLVAGEGTERQRIEEEIVRLGLQDSVQILGVRRDVAALLAASDVFVLSSEREGLPIAVLEAMAAGCPVVATAVGDLPSVITNGVNGFLAPPGDADALANGISRILDDPRLASAMGESGRQLVRREFSLQAMIEKYEKLFQ